MGNPLFVSLAMAALSGGAPACPVEGSGSVADLHAAWILEGWERREGDPRFVFEEKLGRFYDFDGKGVVIHDSWDPQKRVARSARQYGSFFEATFDSFKSARHAVTDGPHVIHGRDLATSSLEFIARLEGRDGKVNAARAQSQTVWRCTDKGWRIVREQNAVDDLDVARADAILQSQPRLTPTIIIEPGARTDERRAVAVLRMAFDDWAAGGNSFFNNVLRDDTVWTIEGSGRYAKTYSSREAFLAEAVAPFAKRLKQPMRPTVRQILSGGNHVAVVWDGSGVAIDGQPYANSYVWLFEMDGDKASRVTAFLDLQAYEAVLQRIKLGET
ncbi:nuclear transport factor 2 family protein [Steroidobacter sp. S1-65]|uniref:Nuclear transport factor 2 family protein n=1 Tax=Steroidobacter gossypii TaxID=2805490 RepID=A0ABS1WV55_9GAMM|nr:nuclear transport factor 2 family protein [Steroidobacter gossypii]MBM0104861.1 nuclear transport factor 2 family protein [Steroidobacter gossypii]